MLRSEAITIIKRGLGFRQTQDASIIAALKQTQFDLEHGHSLPEWLMVYDVALTMTVSGKSAPLPDGFLRIHDDFPNIRYTNSYGKVIELPKRTYTEAIAAYADTTSVNVFPQVYSLTGLFVRFHPNVTGAPFAPYMSYYKAAVVLDTEVENAWLKYAPNYLVGLAGVRVAGDLRDQGAMQKFATMAKSGAASYMGEIVDRELSGRPLIMGRNN